MGVPAVALTMRVEVARVCEAFALGEVADEPRFAARGAMGSVFRVATDQGEWAVKELFDWWDATGVDEQARFVDAARERGVAAPRIVRSVSGSIIAVVDGVAFRVYEWVPNSGSLERPLPAERLREGGRILAHLHHAAFPRSDTPDQWYMSRFRGVAWTEFATAIRAREPELAVRLDEAHEELEILDRLSAEHPGGDWHMCHRDFTPANLLVTTDGALTVVDWENAGPLDFASELGYVIVSWTRDNDEVREFLEGYSSVRDVPPARGRHGFTVGLAAFLNFMSVMLETVAFAGTVPREEVDRARSIANGLLTMIPGPDRLDELAAIWSTYAP